MSYPEDVRYCNISYKAPPGKGLGGQTFSRTVHGVAVRHDPEVNLTEEFGMRQDRQGSAR
jgi:hypothetical protein